MRKLSRRALVALLGSSTPALAQAVAATPAAAATQAHVGEASFATLAAVAAASIPHATLSILVLRAREDTPAVPTRYVRFPGPERGAGIIASADGALWRIAADPVHVSSFGDDGAAIQMALDSLGGQPGTVIIPIGSFVIDTPLRLAAGQTLQGSGFSTIPNSRALAGGTVLRCRKGGRAIEIRGATKDMPIERVRVRSLAIAGLTRTGEGLYIEDGRYIELGNIYITGFDIGLKCNSTLWLNAFTLVQVFDCRIGIYCNSGSEDTTFRSCISRYCDVALMLNYHSQTNSFYGCDFGHSRVSVQMNVGKNLRMSALFSSCIFEYAMEDSDEGVRAVFYLNAAKGTLPRNFPCITVDSSRFHCTPKGADVPVFVISSAQFIRLSNSRVGGTFSKLVVGQGPAPQFGRIVLSGNQEIAKVISDQTPGLASALVIED